MDPLNHLLLLKTKIPWKWDSWVSFIEPRIAVQAFLGADLAQIYVQIFVLKNFLRWFEHSFKYSYV